MKKQLSFRIHPLLAAVIAVGTLFVVLFSIYGINRWASAGEVIGHVRLAEADLGGKTVDQAFATVDELEVGRLSRVVSFTVDGSTVQLRAASTGLDIPEDAIVAEAMAVGRTGNFASQFLWWLTHIFDDYEIELVGTVDPAAMDEIYDRWDTDVIAKPTHPGSIEIVEGELVATYPQTGVGIMREAATPIILDSMLEIVPSVAEIPTVTVEPKLTAFDVDEALAEARRLLAGPITLVFEDRQTVFTVDQLKAAFVSETIVESSARIVNSFDPAVIDEQLEGIRA
ncbi:MAG: hypothetical protein R3246_11115 [Acidimicrobiia bacterium]|nr:hypothetical protein [Acidimicrobiia bacterium]